MSGPARSMASWVASYGFVDTSSLYQASRSLSLSHMIVLTVCGLQALSIDPPSLWQLHKFTPEHTAKLKPLLEEAGCESQQRRGERYGLGQEGFSAGYLGCLRVALLDESELQELVPGECAAEQPVGIVTEQRVHGLILDFLRTKLKRYATTIAQDGEELQQPDLSLHLRTIIQLRQREKVRNER